MLDYACQLETKLKKLAVEYTKKFDPLSNLTNK